MSEHTIERFLDSRGKVERWPGKHKDRLIVLEYLANGFKFNVAYHERDVNEILKSWHTFEDWAVLRRGLVDNCFLQRNRDGTEYRRVNKNR